MVIHGNLVLECSFKKKLIRSLMPSPLMSNEDLLVSLAGTFQFSISLFCLVGASYLFYLLIFFVRLSVLIDSRIQPVQSSPGNTIGREPAAIAVYKQSHNMKL